MSKKTKDLVLIFLALVFGVGVVGFSAVRVSQAEVQMQTGEEEKVEVIKISGSETDEQTNEEKEAVVGEQDGFMPPLVSETNEDNKSTASAGLKTKQTEEVDYYLPYPGILPDHPLYWLKMARDRILLTLTRKPEERFERLLLYADKRIGATEALVNGGKTELGVTTADKAEKYLEQAINQFQELAKEGQAMPEMEDKIKRSTLKHKEVLNSVLDKLSDQLKPILTTMIEKTEQNYQKLDSQFD